MSRALRACGATIALLGLAFGPVTSARAGATLSPAITARYQPPTFKVLVQGHGFTPSGQVEVFVLGPTGLLAHDTITATVQGTFSDRTGVKCAFIPLAAVALDDGAKQWSNLATLPSVCPG